MQLNLCKIFCPLKTEITRFPIGFRLNASKETNDGEIEFVFLSFEFRLSQFST